MSGSTRIAEWSDDGAVDARADAELLRWLLEGDPAIRWRVMRYLTGAGAQEVAQERGRVATEGWGARLLAAQDRDGGWGGGVYSPKWISTTCTLLRLLWLGLPAGHPAALRGCDQLWRWQAQAHQQLGRLQHRVTRPQKKLLQR